MTEINNSDDFDAMMIELFNDIVDNNNLDEDSESEDIIFSDKAKEMIHAMAEYARTTEFYNNLFVNDDFRTERDEYTELAKTKSASLLWMDMCNKLLNAPTSFHMACVPILLIPAIDDKLRSESNEALQV